MKKASTGVIAFSLSVFFAMAHASPPTVNAEQMDLEPEMTAKIVKEKSKHSIAQGMKAGRGAEGGSSSDCGSVNINSGGNDKKSTTSGIKEMFGKQSTTIVTGPIINMANCK
jgi:hypothetical protein